MLSRIHNTSLTSAYFGLDKRECLEYLFIIIIYYVCMELTSNNQKQIKEVLN
jgi:hypothetical protein